MFWPPHFLHNKPIHNLQKSDRTLIPYSLYNLTSALVNCNLFSYNLTSALVNCNLFISPVALLRKMSQRSIRNFFPLPMPEKAKVVQDSSRYTYIYIIIFINIANQISYTSCLVYKIFKSTINSYTKKILDDTPTKLSVLLVMYSWLCLV